MNGEVKIIDIQDVRGYVDENNTVWLNLEDVSRGLGFTQPTENGKSIIRWDRVAKCLTFLGINVAPTSACREIRDRLPEYVSENVFFYILARDADNPISYNFQRRMTREILPMIRKSNMSNNTRMTNQIEKDFNRIVKEYNKIKEEFKKLRERINELENELDY